MKKRILRFFAALCTLFLLTAYASAEFYDHAFNFTLSAQMNADAYPEQSREIVTGLADFINRVSLTGTADIEWAEPYCFDTSFSMLVDSDPETQTDFRIFGRDSHWNISGNLLGNESVLINHLALCEFASKTFFHLDLNIAPVVLLISPFSTSNAFRWIVPTWRDTFAGIGTRTIARDDIMKLADFISENASYDPYFKYWINCLFLQMGYNDMVLDSFATVSEWADGFLSTDGITITCNNDSQVWTSGTRTLFERNGYNWTLTLPVSIDGYRTSVTCESDGISAKYNLIWKNKRGEQILNAVAQWSMLPDHLPFEGVSDILLSLSGTMVSEPTSIHWTLSSDGESFCATQHNVATGETMMTISGNWQETESKEVRYQANEIDGFNFLSMDDNSLPAFIKSVLPYLAKGILPILVHAPASTYHAIFTFLEDHGILGLLSSGL